MTPAGVPRFWRAVAPFVAGSMALAVLTVACLQLRLNLATTVCLYLRIIVLLSLQGSFLSSAVVSLIAVGCVAYYFAPPDLSFEVSDPLDIVATIAFLTTAAVITRSVSSRLGAADNGSRAASCHRTLPTTIEAHE
jgi:K+-sensing histidine kinase KdpD